MAISVSLAGTLTASDPNTGTLNISKTLSQTFAGSISSQGEAVRFGTSPTILALPINPVQVVYINNLSAINTLTVTWTPTGGLSATIIVLQPLAAILMVESNLTTGVSAISLTASGANTPADFFLAG